MANLQITEQYNDYSFTTSTDLETKERQGFSDSW